MESFLYWCRTYCWEQIIWCLFIGPSTTSKRLAAILGCCTLKKMHHARRYLGTYWYFPIVVLVKLFFFPLHYHAEQHPGVLFSPLWPLSVLLAVCVVRLHCLTRHQMLLCQINGQLVLEQLPPVEQDQPAANLGQEPPSCHPDWQVFAEDFENLHDPEPHKGLLRVLQLKGSPFSPQSHLRQEQQVPVQHPQAEVHQCQSPGGAS